MEKVVFKASRRNVIGKQVRALRRQGQLPAVIYGHHVEPLPISLNAHDAAMRIPRVSSSQLITLDVDGTPHTVLVRERQRHPVTENFLHIDFLEVSMTEKIRITVSLQFTGDAPAVKLYNGIVIPSLEQIEVECLPDDLPNLIEVSLSGLTEIGDMLYVRDLQTPARVTVLQDPNEVIVAVTAPASDAELEGQGGSAEPEVIEKGKKDEDNF
jgi:large subunit ribosomal protein L25